MSQFACRGFGADDVFRAVCAASSMWALSSVLATAGAAEEVPATQTGQLETVTVSASKLGSDITKAAVSATVLAPQDMEKNHLVNIEDIAVRVPNLVFDTPALSSQMYIRGIGTNFALAGQESSVATYVDGVYLQRQAGATLDLVDLQSVNVLNGPQGTLYGRNATGGVVLLNTADPTDTFGGMTAAEGGNIGQSRFQAVVNIPVNDTLAIRVAGQHRHNDGYLRDINTGQMRGEGSSDLVRVKVRWAPTADFTAKYTAEYGQLLTTSYQQTQLETAPLCFACALYPNVLPATGQGFYITSQSQNTYNNVYWDAQSLTLNYAPGWLNVTSVTGYRQQSVKGRNELDTAAPEFFVGKLPETGPTLSNDTYASTTFSGPLNGLVGASYLHDRDRMDFFLLGDIMQGTPGRNTNHVRIDSYSFYGQLNYDFTSSLELTAGARYNHDKKAIDVDTDAPALAILAPGVPGAASFTKEADFHNITPRVVLSYRVDGGYYYASYNRGAKSGAFAAPISNPGITAVKPEVLDSFEIGAKNTLLDGRLHTTFDFFWGKFKDIQVQTVDAITGTVLLENAASAKTRGAEFTGTFNVSSAFNAAAGAAFLRNTYDSFPDAVIFSPGIPGSTTCPPAALGFASCRADLSGTTAPRSPKWSGFVSGDYSQSLPGNWVARLSAIAHFTTAFDFSAGAGGPLGLDHQGGYATVDSTLTFNLPNETTEIGAFVTNLLEHRYLESRTTQAFGATQIPAMPRTYGVRVSQRF